MVEYANGVQRKLSSLKDPGAYRRIQNYAANSKTGEVIYTPSSTVKIPIMMSEMIKWFNSDR